MLLHQSSNEQPEIFRVDLAGSKVALMALVLALGWISPTVAQQNRLPAVWPMYHDDMAPGVIGQTQIYRRPQAYGYFQPVEITGPEGLRISMATSGVFDEPKPAPFRAALLVGAPYRIRVGGIRFEDGQELYPTIEVIDRLYPLPEREHRMPIPIELDENDLMAALRGDLVTRVIYLEDSEIAEPISYAEGDQRVRDVYGADDALQTADQLGRPVAILRIGSRTPSESGLTDNTEFLFGSPTWYPIKDIPNRRKLIDSGIVPQSSTPPVTIQSNPPPSVHRLETSQTMRIGG